MTAEQHTPQLTIAESTQLEVEFHSPQHRRQIVNELGHTSLDGFTVMEAATSPWEDVRSELEARIISQPTAINAIVEALEGSTVRVPSDKRPIANLAFLGPTGVGKSETAKSLAELIPGTSKLVKIDCSDFSHGHEIASLIGSPVGYVGYGEDAVFSKKAIESYGTVILFDEIEKGSEQLYNLMLQIMEDGELKLGNGDITSFRDSLIIMTSNLGAKEMSAQLSSSPLGFAGPRRQTRPEQLDSVATKSFKEFFRPEFINRLSKMVVFHPLDRDSLGQVLDSKLATTNREYEDEFGARVTMSDDARSYLLDIAANELHMGARPLVRALDENIYSTFGRYWGSGAIDEGTHVKVFHYSEVGIEKPTDDATLIFTSKHDDSIHRKIKPTEFLMIEPVEEVSIPDVETLQPDDGTEPELDE